MDKVVIYLDQNFISDIAKLSMEDRKSKVNPLLGELYEEIKTGVDEEKFLSPDSWVHAIETAWEKDPELQKSIQGYQGYLGQVSLQSEDHIKNHQFAQALFSFCGIEIPLHRPWKVAFHENPNKRLQNFNVKVRWNSNYYKNLCPISADGLMDIQNNVKNEKGQYKAEIDAQRNHYAGIVPYEFKALLEKHEIDMEKVKSFIASNHFCEIPNIDIFSRMWSKNFTFKRKKEQLTHDFNDISFLSLFMPYCDVIATDKHMKNLVSSLKLDAKYSCHVYSLTEEDLRGMHLMLEQLRGEVTPANQSLFSVVCTKPNEQQMYSVEFLQMLNGVRNKFERTGKYWNQEVYTSVFLAFSEEDKIEAPEPIDGYWKLSQEQWADMLISGHDFKRITTNTSLEDTIAEIPPHLRGSGTAVIESKSIFQNDLDQLFYDIESAIENKLPQSEKFKVKIIYPAITRETTSIAA